MKSRIFTLVMTLVLVLGGTSVRSATITWTNTAGGNWSVAANWSPNQVPTNTDTAQITTSGTYTVTNSGNASVSVLTLGGASGTQTLRLSSGNFALGSASAGNGQGVLNLAGGTLGGAGSLVLAGPLTWTGGTISNVVQFAGGTFSGSLALNGGEVINSGTLNWSATTINTGNGSIISNAVTGTINLTGNLTEGGFVGTRTFNNAGQLNVAVVGTANISDTFTNTGTVAVNGGTLNLSGGGSESGPITVASGATFTLGGGTVSFNSGSSISGLGTNNVNGGIANWSGTAALTIANLTISAGTANFSGTGTLTPGNLTISSSGTLTGTAIVPVQNSGGFTWSGGAIVTNVVQFNGGTFSGSLSLNGGQVINAGTLNWTAATVNTGNGSVISNAVTGIINLTANLSQSSFGPGRTFNNAGQLNVAVSGTANIGDTFNNTGTVTNNAGTLELSGGGTESGSFTVASGATLDLGGGTIAFNPGSTLSGAGNFTVAGATATIGVALNLGGTWTFSSGTATLSSTTTVNGNAVIVSGGTVNFNGAGPWQPGTLTISSSGTLGGAALVTVQNTGGLTWSGGTISGVVQFPGGTFSGSTLSLNGGQAINNGTLNWSATVMDGGNGSILSNAVSGIINLTANLTEGSFGGTRTFNNAGQLNVTVSGSANIGETFNNTGTVAVNGGTLNLSGGGTESGPFTIASGATNELSSGTYAINSGTTISGAGIFLNASGTANFNGTSALSAATVNIAGGTVNFNNSSSLNLALVNLSGGTLTGSNPVLVSGAFNWTGGTITTNVVQFNGGTFSGALSLNNGGQVVNTGTLNWTSGSFSTGNGSVISNAVTGIINLTASFADGSLGGIRTFNNAGQFNVTVSGTANFGDVFNNTGTVAVNTGTLNLSGGGTESGLFTAASGATNELSGGTFAINSGTTISGAGIFLNASGTANFTGTSTLSTATVNIAGGTVIFNNSSSLNLALVNLSGGTLTGSNPVLVSGAFNWTGGTIATNVVQFNGGTFSGALGLNSGGQVINTGTLNWTSGSLSTGNGSIISNAVTGIINLTANFSEGNFGGIRAFNNAGQLNATVPGITTISDTFNNTGTLAVNGGVLNLSGSHNLTNGTLNFGITNLSTFGALTLSGASALAGALSASFKGGFLPATNNSWQIINYASPSGSFSQTNLPPVAVWQVTTNPTFLTIKVLKLIPQMTWPTPADIVYGTALSSTQLNATANWNGSPVPGTFNYNPAVGTVLQSGSNQTLSVTFVPSDTATYTNATATVSINVQKAPLTVTANNSNKLYGQTVTFAGTEFSTSGLVNGDSVTNATLASPGAAPTASVAGSPYTITITSALGDAGLTNYIITYANGQLTVNPAPLTITANSTAKTYGQNLIFAGTEFVPTGLQNLETVGTVTLTSAGAISNAPVSGSPYNIVPSAATGGTFTPGNYSISYVNGALTVNKAVLGVTANNRNKTYGQNITFAGTEFVSAGLQNLETIGTVTLTSAGAISNAPVSGSPYSIVPSAATGGTFTPGNYSISYTNGTLTVGTAPLGITANNRNKSYGQVVSFAGTEFAASGLQNSETVGSVTLTSPGASGTASVAGSPYNIVPSAATGGTFTPGNYFISYTNGVLTVNRTGLTITADNTNKIFGETLTFAGTEFTAGGLQNSETVGTVILTSAGAPAVAAAGIYSIVPSAPAGGTFSQGNYTNTFVNGTLTVVAPPLLTVTASGNHYILAFPTLSGQTYQLQSRTNLTVPAWAPLGGPIAGTSGIVSVTNNIVVPQSFFRLQIGP